MRINEISETHSGEGSGSLNVFISIGATLIVTLILGSYVYTWLESDNQSKEKKEWRIQHEQTLDKRFDELKLKQDRIETAVHESHDQTALLLQQLIDRNKAIDDKNADERRRK